MDEKSGVKPAAQHVDVTKKKPAGKAR